MEDVTPLRCGVRLDPPALIVTYSDGTGSTRRRSMPLKDLTARCSLTEFVSQLRSSPKHQAVVQRISLRQLIKLLTVVQESLKGVPLSECISKCSDVGRIDPEEDLNKVDEDTLKKKKMLMDDMFEKNRKKPGDSGFQYDIEVDFDVGGAVETVNWSSDEESGGF